MIARQIRTSPRLYPESISAANKSGGFGNWTKKGPELQGPTAHVAIIAVAEIAHQLKRKALEELAAVAKPDTLLAWYRKLIGNKFDGSKFRKSSGRPRVDEETERLVVRMAKENPGWGYDRIVRSDDIVLYLANSLIILGCQTSDFQFAGPVVLRFLGPRLSLSAAGIPPIRACFRRGIEDRLDDGDS